MKLQNLSSDRLEEFFEVVSKCEGSVYLKSPDMYINLKSNLAKYVSLASLCAAGASEIKEIEILTSNRNDIDRLYKFMSEGTV